MPDHAEALTIRLATHDDVAALVLLARDAFRAAYRTTLDADEVEDYVTQTYTPAMFEAVLADARSTLLLAVDDDRLRGYAHVSQSEPPPCVVGPAPIELARLYLAPDAIGRGHGAALMRAVHAEARRRAGQTLWLGVYERNAPAIAFYRRWGFVVVGSKPFLFAGRYYDDPIMLMPIRSEP